MTRYIVRTYMNVGDTTMWRYEPGDKLEYGPELRVVADSPAEALNKVWEVGNRMGADANGREWPSDCRSLCSGDVIFAGGIGAGDHAFYTVDAVGFSRLSADDWYRSMNSPKARERHPGLSAWRNGEVRL